MIRKRGEKMGTLFWLMLFVIFLIIEIGTMGLTTIWFAGGALVAFILTYFGAGTTVQIVTFLVISIGLLLVTRPIAMRFFNQKRQTTNADSLIGKKAVVYERIDTLHGEGRVEINGMEWSARTVSPEGIVEKDTVVIVEDIQGVKLIVKVEEA